jgi:hypothetical protein
MLPAGFRIPDAKALFFDRQRVISQTSKAERKVLSKFGAFVRTRSRSSIRKRKKPAEPGSPPSGHTGELKKWILFVYDPNRHSVIIGPARLNSKIGDAPHALEHGGQTTVRKGSRRKPHMRTVTIRARPVMQPAFDRERQGLPQLWRNSISN